MLQTAMSAIESIDYRSYSLHNLKNLMIVSDTRPSPELCKYLVRKISANLYVVLIIYHAAVSQILSTFLANRLEDAAINAIYSPAVNPFVTSRAYVQSEPQSLAIDIRALRYDLIRIPEDNDSPFSLVLHDSGKVSKIGRKSETNLATKTLINDVKVPGNTMIAIVNEEGRMCRPGQVGEIWVASDGNAIGPPSGDAPPVSSDPDPFCVYLEEDNRSYYARTGDLGFCVPARTGNRSMEGFAGVCLYVLGKVHNSFRVNGLRHYAVDVEASIESCHRNIAPSGRYERCFVLNSRRHLTVRCITAACFQTKTTTWSQL